MPHIENGKVKYVVAGFSPRSDFGTLYDYLGVCSILSKIL